MANNRRTGTTISRAAAGRYAFALAIVSCLGIGVYLTAIDSSATIEQKLSGAGVSLVASAVFALIFSLLSDRENRSLIREEISANFGLHSEAMLGEWSKKNVLHLPMSAYSATEGFDRAFNIALMGAFEQSSTFYFRGVSAKYIPARIKAARVCPDSMKIYISGPSAEAAIRTRVADRLKNPKYADSDPNALFESLREEMITSFVGLYDCRAYSSIDVVFFADTSVTRLELTDSQLFMSWYHSPSADASAFPETFGFTPESLPYRTNKLDLIRRGDISRQTIRVRRDLTALEMCSILSELFDRPFTAADLEAYRQTYWRSMAKFVDFLDALS